MDRATQQDPSLEAQLQATLNMIPAHTWYAAPTGALQFLNTRGCDYLGLPEDHPMRFGIRIGAAWDSHFSFLHPDDHEETRRVWSTCLRAGCAGEVSFRVRNAEGGYRWFLSRAEPIRASDGTLLFWIGVNLDNDYAKRAEEALQRSDFFLTEAQRLGHTGSWAFDATGFQYWSSDLFRMHGLDPSTEPPTIAEYLTLVHQDDRELMLQAIQNMSADHRAFDITKRIVRPDGNTRYVRCVGSPVTQDGIFQGFVGSVMDVTEEELLTQELRRRETYPAETNEALRKTEAYLAEAQALSLMGSWAWRIAGRDAVHLSDEWYRIYGFDPKQGMPAWNERLQRVHPEDRNKWRETIEEAIREKSNYDVEFRILLPDGTLKWVHTVGHPVFTETGELVQFVGSSMDITARKQAEEQLKAQETACRQMLDLVPQHVHVILADGRLVYSNEMALVFHDDALDEWRQRPLDEWNVDEHPLKIIHPDDREPMMSAFRRNSSTGSPYEIEARLLRNDGVYRWFLFRCNPLRDEQSRAVRWYIAGTDIDDRKRTEERLQRENVALREEINESSMFEEIVGTSPALKTVLSHISKVAPSDSTVLITGETGTGKELVARAIHRRSDRSSRAFISVNCAAIPRDLIASELFGHEKGAFTGATQRRIGRFELADGGTIFLDEVGELLPDTQAALLRVLQEREFERIGGMRPICINVRIIAASNRNLEEAVANGAFRPDLFYRLNVFPIQVPSLRERTDDIPILVEYFIDRYARKAGKTITGIDKQTLDLLNAYPWPGNIRELQNVVERSVIVCETETFSVDRSWLSRDSAQNGSSIDVDLGGKLAAHEKKIIEEALTVTAGRISGPQGAAAKLGISPSTLESKIKALNIKKHRFKS
jgi:PAS domain S-box-containing protein